MTAKDESIKRQQNDKTEDKVQDEIFATEEIVIEEMAIDGICGVY
ncbi:MAG: mycofactocin precursor [Deltaproteobacteria bacterium]|nr:mycofactocin precursor [Deltaproteobacteria bacterium]MBW2112493.1 mycofactocin precursor [Deltaproteobacteria bacterium]MBW2354377.1 mycofactocin precursor [Deltaproteobacteria bacterium]HDZ23424.1 mycofactocin precursor [Desulfobacteraceae bacterium]